jgi:hypothetical protein
MNGIEAHPAATGRFLVQQLREKPFGQISSFGMRQPWGLGGSFEN